MSDSAVAKVAPAPPQVLMDGNGLQLRSLDEAWRFANLAKASGLAPPSLDTAEKILIALQTGMEAGLSPTAALRAVNVIKGLPSWKGEAALGLIRSKGVCAEGPDPFVRGDGDKREGVLRFRRKEMAEAVEVTFSVADAKRAGLWGNGNWSKYPDDMLQWRAVSRAGKRYFNDVLMGLPIAEEVADYAPTITTEPKAALPATTADPLFEEQLPVVEVDPDTGEVIPENVGRDEQGALL